MASQPVGFFVKGEEPPKFYGQNAPPVKLFTPGLYEHEVRLASHLSKPLDYCTIIDMGVEVVVPIRDMIENLTKMQKTLESWVVPHPYSNADLIHLAESTILLIFGASKDLHDVADDRHLRFTPALKKDYETCKNNFAKALEWYTALCMQTPDSKKRPSPQYDKDCFKRVSDEGLGPGSTPEATPPAGSVKTQQDAQSPSLSLGPRSDSLVDLVTPPPAKRTATSPLPCSQNRPDAIDFEVHFDSGWNAASSHVPDSIEAEPSSQVPDIEGETWTPPPESQLPLTPD